jgi:hypothetical protein
MSDSTAEVNANISSNEVTSYRWYSANEKDRFPVKNPATGAVITIVQGGGATEVNAAVEAAHHAFGQDWRWRPPAERARMLLEVGTRCCHPVTPVTMAGFHRRSTVELCRMFRPRLVERVSTSAESALCVDLQGFLSIQKRGP